MYSGVCKSLIVYQQVSTAPRFPLPPPPFLLSRFPNTLVSNYIAYAIESLIFMQIQLLHVHVQNDNNVQ